MGKRAGQPGVQPGAAPVPAGQSQDTQDTQQQTQPTQLQQTPPVQPAQAIQPPAGQAQQASATKPLKQPQTPQAPQAPQAQQLQRLQSSEQPQKKVKKEPPASATRQRDPAATSMEPTQKKPRQRDGMSPAPAVAPSPARAPSSRALDENQQAVTAKRPRRVPRSSGIAWALSEVKTQLEAISDVEGVRDLMKYFPECVLLGGIAARRELVGALLGETSVAASAAAILVAPGVRQPMALELRCGQMDVATLQGREAEAWLRSVQQAAQQALGQRLKVDPLCLRLSAAGCANLDVVDLPEKCGLPSTVGTPPKIEEMQMRYLGSQSNLLVCLEPGPPLELCRRFDPQLKRTVLVGAAASSVNSGGDDNVPANVLCGSDAATSLEERFAALCNERVPQWIQGLERLETRLSRSNIEARNMEEKENSDEVLRQARAAGLSFGRALSEVIGGTPGCSAGALTLEEDLVEFAAACQKGYCSTPDTLSGKDAAAGAADLFAHFGGVEAYAAYLRKDVKIAGADVPLNGGAAWRRVLAEVEVAMRLAHPPAEALKEILASAISCGGTGVHGHKHWEDVSSKLMMSISYQPLLLRIRYVTARVVWILRHQKLAVSEWMSVLADGPGSRMFSPLFAQHLGVLRSSPIVRDLVFGAYDDAVGVIGEQVLKNLQGTLTAACINPEIMLRPKTEVDLEPKKRSAKVANAQATPAAEEAAPDQASAATPSAEPSAAATATPASGKSSRAAEARKRVIAEMKRRSGPSGGLPRNLQERVFDAKEAKEGVPAVAHGIINAFTVLSQILANQAFAFADASLHTLTRRQVDEAMANIDFSSEQKRVLSDRHKELVQVARQVEDRLMAVRRCLSSLRTAEVVPSSTMASMAGMR
eukprot:TRINITY_DN3880_c0_g1_i1.p1 TRINITY_DN3880_c0_g1~~TRINITY_DN3880_c0_g1_i1.p1  ORF type:complete len:876 (-),score=197.09 TRINITY_DN3880_c0_g1_i1:78-2705(-)